VKEKPLRWCRLDSREWADHCLAEIDRLLARKTLTPVKRKHLEGLRQFYEHQLDQEES
jgi:hypothetical protein